MDERITCHFCERSGSNCLPNGVRHYTQIKAGKDMKEKEIICKYFKPASWAKGLQKEWNGFDSYIKELAKVEKESFCESDPFLKSSLNVTLIQDNVAYSIRAYDWMMRTFLDPNLKIKNYVYKRELKKNDINYIEVIR